VSAAPRASADASTPLASFKRRLISLIYEALILAAVLMAGALPVVMLTHQWHHTAARITLQLSLLVLCGAFYIWQWTRTGQTLPMKTWRLKLVTTDGTPLDARRACLRYFAALLTIATAGLGFLWALIDRDRQFLHDRIAGTRIMQLQ
jgi:uncharacterized RDD family membrane protein YckC